MRVKQLYDFVIFCIDMYCLLFLSGFILYLAVSVITMWIWWWWIYFLLVWTPVYSLYLGGSLGEYKPQKILMLHDHSVCLSNIQHMSLRQTLTYGFLCVKFKVLHCLLKKNMKYYSLGENNFPGLQKS